MSLWDGVGWSWRGRTTVIPIALPTSRALGRQRGNRSHPALLTLAWLAPPLHVQTASAAVSELDRQARVGTGSTETFVNLGPAVEQVAPARAEKLVPSSLAKETIVRSASAELVVPCAAIDTVPPGTCSDIVIATTCTDEVPTTPAANFISSASCDDDVPMVRAHDVIRP